MKRLEAPAPDDRRVWDIWMSAFHFQALAVADELGVFGLFMGEPANAADVASRLGLNPLAAGQLLSTLAALGFLTYEDGRFGLTDEARNFLLPASPFYWGPGLAYFRQIAVSFDRLREVLHSPRWTPDRAEPGSPDAEEAARFTRAMHSLSMPAAMAVARRGDFDGVRRLLDVGGGSGSYCIALALEHPDLALTVLERPQVLPTTQDFIAGYGLQRRIDTVGFDLFSAPWPSEYDAHFFSNVFHDFDAELCRWLASSSYGSLPSGGRVYAHEVLVDDTKDAPLTSVTFSLAMTYFNEAGGQYTAGEIEAFLGDAGFRDVRCMPTYGYYSLVSATKP